MSRRVRVCASDPRYIHSRRGAVDTRGCGAWRSELRGNPGEKTGRVSMRAVAVRRTLVGVCAAAALLVLGTGSASAQNFFHGIAFTKGCDSPTDIGDPYTCAYSVLNVADTAHDTLTFNGISDQVHAFTGDVNSGNI